ncbi:MAG: aromatic ring-hydroxylating dioxygenase subunit alpha [Alphaproteobacteria bacterium]|nr:aromatic ring-hydroxylating dioxygenase subunit alpha [Alphaproteobacteria bacterium]
MPWTSRYPELGTGPLPVEPIISPALFEQERTKIFKRVWLNVGRVEEIANPGDYKVKRLDVARTSAILVRRPGGEICAFHNICPHRGNKVIPESGNETFGRARANLLTCRFHGWVFETAGAVRSIPREEAFADLHKACFGLRPIACEVWEGFIFVNLAAEPEQSLTDYLGGFGEHFSGYPYGESTARYKYSAVLNCNWKVSLHAFSEGYHVSTIHSGTSPNLMRFEHKDFRLFGPHSTSAFFVLPIAGLEPSPASALFREVLHRSERHRPRLHEIPPTMNHERRTDFLFEFPVIFPNMLLHLSAGNGYPGMTYFTHHFWPLSVGQTLWEGTNYFRPPESASERIAIAHTTAYHRNGWLEDTSTMEDTHAALSSGVLEEIVLMDEEIMIRNTHHHWDRYMRAA